MKFLVRFGRCVLVAAFLAFQVPVQAQPGGWYGGGGAGFWMTGYAPPVPLFGAYPGNCAPAYSVSSPMVISAASYGGDACCVPLCCDPCGSSCGTGCVSGSCAGCEPGTGSLKPNADANFRKKSPSHDPDAEESPGGWDRNRDQDPAPRRPNETGRDQFRGSRPRGAAPAGSRTGGPAEDDFPPFGDGTNSQNSDGAGGGASGTKPSGSGNDASESSSDTNENGGLFDSDGPYKTKKAPISHPETEETTEAPKSGTGDPAENPDNWSPSGKEGKPDDVAPTGDRKEFLSPENTNGAEKSGSDTRFDTDESPSGPRIAGVPSQLREVIPFKRLAVAGQGSAGRRLSGTTSARPASRWISVPMKAGHVRL